MSRRLICVQKQPPRFPRFGPLLRGIRAHRETRHSSANREHPPGAGHGRTWLQAAPAAHGAVTWHPAAPWHVLDFR